eukprot:scaffold3305_cov328-Pinguiococcus_pyrenoidosus.AAC.10
MGPSLPPRGRLGRLGGVPVATQGGGAPLRLGIAGVFDGSRAGIFAEYAGVRSGEASLLRARFGGLSAAAAGDQSQGRGSATRGLRWIAQQHLRPSAAERLPRASG